MRLIDADEIRIKPDFIFHGVCGTPVIRCEDLARIINDMPTIEPQKWSPVSERLPSDEDYDETFTVTIQCEHYDGWDDYVTGYADWTPHGWDIQSCYIGQIKVIAWMPLPEPYQPKEEKS